MKGFSNGKYGEDDLPLAILTYAQGKGYYNHTYAVDNEPKRVDLNDETVDMKDFRFRSPTSAPLSSETHSGADVGIFAQGKQKLYCLLMLFTIGLHFQDLLLTFSMEFMNKRLSIMSWLIALALIHLQRNLIANNQKIQQIP